MTLTLLDLVVIWCLPMLLIFTTILIFAAVVCLLMGRSQRSDLVADINHRVEQKRRLRSAKRRRWLYPHVVGLMLLDNGVQALCLYRVSHYLGQHRLRLLAEVVHAFAKFVTHIDLSPYADIGPGATIFHGSGAVIGKYTRIGKRVLICQGVTTGSGRPQIGDDVILWSGAKILGNVVVGDRVAVGANAVVISDVPSDCNAVGVPAKRFLPRSDLRHNNQAVALPLDT